jgi:zinc/manganese transport system substrate-binding protein
VYHDQKTGKFIAKKTGAKFIVLPHDVNAVDEADSLENFYSVIAKRLCQ